MLTISPAVRVFLAATPTDMRLSFDRLAALVDRLVGEDPLSGHLFVFRNRHGDRVKILIWDRTGYVLWYKRLEEGVFHFPHAADGRAEVDAAELALLLEGIDLEGARREHRYRRPMARGLPAEQKS